MKTAEYLERIHYQASSQPTIKTLRALHEAHLLTVPFENLSIHLGQPIVLQEEALYEKIVRQRRGGFCYELNGLFAWLLGQIGFEVSLLSCEVAGEDGTFSAPFDHLALLVHDLSGADWLADVGFGESFRRPLCFEQGWEQREADGQVYRLVRQDEEPRERPPAYWIMQRMGEPGWEDQYRFTLQAYTLDDFSARCQYHQTSPASHFTQKRICSLATLSGRISLSDWRLITTSQGVRTERVLSSQEDYTAALAEYFGVFL